MSLSSTLNLLKNDIETKIASCGDQGIDPPAHLLEMRYYLLGSNASAANQEVEIERLEQIRDRLFLAEAPLVTENALTAVGVTPSRSCLGYNKITFQVDVTGIGTNVVVRIEGNLVGSSFVNLNTANSDTTITADGTYLFVFDGKVSKVRLNLVSINGGSPVVQAHLLLGN